ncbi:MAG: rod shape-determining protein MreC [Phycisphaerae bacterium]|nr:rod shape-determining protein MreC [Phycisphaerae bacterium]
MRLPNKKQTFWLLMIASAISVAVSPQVVNDQRGLFGPILAPLSGWLYQGSLSLRNKASGWATGDSTADARRVEAERNAYLAEVVNVTRQNEQLRAQLKEVTGLKDEQAGLRGRLVPATVLARDAVAWRESLLIDMGRNVHLQPKQWALARMFIDRGADGGVAENQLAVLSLSSPQARKQYNRSVLVGRVEQVGQVTARVRLLTDWDSTVDAQVLDPAKPADTILCRVRGNGRGQLLAEGVVSRRTRAGDRDTDEPPCKTGDLVLSAPNAGNLPSSLIVGVVRSVARGAKPLEYTLKIDPAADYSLIARLIVIDAVDPKDGH